MDRRAWLDHAARSEEERVVLGRIWDGCERCRRRNVPVVTPFLSPREQAAAAELLRALDMEDAAVFFGGYPDAERRQLHLLPEWMEGPDESELAALRCTFYPGQDPDHRDFLGSLMGLGVQRGTIGDILVGERSADVLVSRSVAPFLREEWRAAGRVPLQVEEIPLSALAVPEASFRESRDTVPSLRLDCLVASAFGVSRSRAAELVAAGRVQVNWLPCQKGDRTAGEGDVLSVRGLGKCQLEAVGGTTKKGRISVTWKRYL
jgi:RNA-binding protein YlmH